MCDTIYTLEEILDAIEEDANDRTEWEQGE